MELSIPRLFRIEEVAALRGESYQATRDAIARKDIKTVRVGARGVRIAEDEVRRLMAEREQPATAARP